MAQLHHDTIIIADQTGAHPAHVAPAVYGNCDGRQVVIGHQLPPQEPQFHSHPPHFQPQSSPPAGQPYHPSQTYPQHQYYAPQQNPHSYPQSGPQQHYCPPAPQYTAQPVPTHAYYQQAPTPVFVQTQCNHQGAPPHQTPPPAAAHQTPPPAAAHQTPPPAAAHQTAPPAAAPAASQNAGAKPNGSAGDQMKKVVEMGKKFLAQHKKTEKQQEAERQQQEAKDMAQVMCPHPSDYCREEPTGLAWMCCCLWLLLGEPAPCTQIRCTNCDLVLQS